MCGADDTLVIARAALHFWEEPPVSLSCGSGTVFFSNCPLRCCYCQNAPIASGEAGEAVTVERLAQICLELEAAGAANINMVTPTHYTPQIAQAVTMAREAGLSLPIVWNTSGYETVATIESLAGIVDVYLADFKYADSGLAAELSHAPDYPDVAMNAIRAMVQQVGPCRYDAFGGEERLVRGVVVRHLLLPGHEDASEAAVSLIWRHFGHEVRLSLMNQYTPVISPQSASALAHPELLRQTSDAEYEALLDFADGLGIEEYFWQDGPAAAESFIPAFDGTGVV